MHVHAWTQGVSVGSPATDSKSTHTLIVEDVEFYCLRFTKGINLWDTKFTALPPTVCSFKHKLSLQIYAISAIIFHHLHPIKITIETSLLNGPYSKEPPDYMMSTQSATKYV